MSVAKFEKVSFEQFRKDWIDTFQDNPIVEIDETSIRHIYDSIKLPKRATKGSAGYDFYSPLKCYLAPGHDIKIPTGIRCRMNSDCVLLISPRSSLGFKYYLRTANIFPVIDSDYYRSDNEGHIFIKVRNESEEKGLILEAGDGFCQGIFIKYGITDDDNASEVRNGGFGSTDNKQ